MRTYILAGFLALLVVAVGLGMYFGLQQFQQTTDVPSLPPQTAERNHRPSLGACELACHRLLICKDDLAGADCVRACREDWHEDSASCIQQAACSEIDLCFEEELPCADVCAKAETCGLIEPGENCLWLCGEQWDQDFRSCLLETPCDEIGYTCMPAVEDQDCADYCDRLAACGLTGSVDQLDCVASCLEIDDPVLRECVFRVECDMITDVCLAENFDPLCLDACRRLERCDALGDIDPGECPLICQDEWDDLILACLFEESCSDLGPVCLERPDPVCEDVCRKLVECELEDEYEDCALVCSANLEPELQDCILDTSCEMIDYECFGEPDDLCAQVCTKAVDCGLDEDYDACYDACIETEDAALINCILSYPCEQIEALCLTPAAPPEESTPPAQ